MARLDPLDLGFAAGRSMTGIMPQELSLDYWGFPEDQLDVPVRVTLQHTKGFLEPERGETTVRKIHERLVEAYSGTIGVEYMHIADVEQCNWIREQFETRDKVRMTKEEKMVVLDRLAWAEHFERFLEKKYGNAKRFGLEGAESTIVGMKAMLDVLASHGAESVVMGMPHRGRLNVLSTIMRKPMEQIFSEFAGTATTGSPDEDGGEFQGSGDVKYHLGLSQTRSINGRDVRLTLVPNPSHLEAVNPVVVGKARAKQYFSGDETRDKVVPMLLHGDAAFAGQGVVYETLGMSELPNYEVGGTLHLVVNNMIGFTTDPSSSRSGHYCTDVAKATGSPVFHVNGNDPEAVVRVCHIAAEFRHRFKKDVVVDLVCYRKHGHNELDEPSFTQPRMYERIKKMESTLTQYEKKLVSKGTCTEEEVRAVVSDVTSKLDAAYERVESYTPDKSDWLDEAWADMVNHSSTTLPPETSVPLDRLREVAAAAVRVPGDFTMHRRLAKIWQEKRAAIEAEEGLDWGTVESLAFGTLLVDGHHVRLSGQDVERGTFSHRHAVLHDQKDHGRRYEPLNQVADGQEHITVSNSHLAEMAVLGFELGYSYENPSSLVIWEAQFADFANSAQVITDQFISAGEAKWRRQSGLVMLLPHGYEGQGPEHSSGRLERFLQMSNEGEEAPADADRAVQQANWQIIHPTTPANYFHALRRQVRRPFRKPLIVMNPKSLLRHRLARSSFADLSDGSEFQPVIGDPDVSKARRLIFCSGKVYYDLVQRREQEGADDVAIVRIEQLTPFPFDRVTEELNRHKKAEVVWVQEEHRNMGPWSHVSPRIESAAGGKRRARYVGRAPSASTAAGSGARHARELEAFLADAFAKK